MQLLFERVYETGPYRRRGRFTDAFFLPPLPADQAEWAKRILRGAGIA